MTLQLQFEIFWAADRITVVGRIPGLLSHVAETVDLTAYTPEEVDRAIGMTMYAIRQRALKELFS